MYLSKLLEEVDVEKIVNPNKNEDREIFILSIDSRRWQKNGLFICLKGENVDSHTCAKEAVENGAVAVMTEKELDVNTVQVIVKDTREALGKISSIFYGEPSRKMKIIGITGTNGKTTTSYMLQSIFQKSGKKTGVIGTLGAFYADKKIRLDLTTPDPIELNRILAEMLLHGVEYVFMEVSAHALHYQKTAGISFAACIFSNLTQDHLDFFQTMENYKKAKMKLFQEDVCPIAIVNADDDMGREIGRLRTNANKNATTMFYGLNTPADSFAIITNENLRKTECMLNINDNLCPISLQIAGRHNVYNALSAAVCATAFEVPVSAIAEGLNSIRGVTGRLERVDSLRGAEIFVDFAHTPDGLGKSLDALRPHCKGRLICLFGCGGNRDKTKRALMGEVAAKKADFCVLTSDNPRYEDPLDIISEIEKGYRRVSVRYVVVPDRKRALEYALDYLKKDDVLLVAGKGAEEYQEIMGIKYAFNDQDMIEKLLEKKGKNPFM